MERIGHLPGMAAARMTAMEVRLQDPSRAVDCSVSVGPAEPLCSYYICRGESAPADSHAARLGKLLVRMREAADTQADDSNALGGVLLEYDVVDVPPGAHPEPGVFLCLKFEQDQSRTLAVATDTLMETVGWTDREVSAAAIRVIEALPPRAGISNIGAMPDRELRAIKIVAIGISAGEIGDFLERAGWQGRMSEVERVMEAMAPVPSRLGLSLDVVEQGLLPRLGLEFLPPAFEKGGAAWLPFIERIAELGWCLPEKKRGLIAFTGTGRVFRDDGLFMLYKGINHVKLTVSHEGVQAKAYIGFSYFPFSASPVTSHHHHAAPGIA